MKQSDNLDKARKIAEEISVKLFDELCTDDVERIIRSALKPFLEKVGKVCEDSEQYDFGEMMSLSTDDVKELAAEYRAWIKG